jgi:hypothetical protein
MIIMTDAEILSIVLGIIGASLGIFTFLFDRYRRTNEEKFYANEIKENLKTITQYFLTISNMSSHYRESENDDKTTFSLNDYYERHSQEMKDLLYLTKLYLTQWKTLSQDKQTLVKDILERFSWLSYEYYPLHLPDSIKKERWQQEWRELDNKKSFINDNVPIILSQNP